MTALAAAAVLAVQLSAAAAEITLTDAVNGTVRISGTAAPEENVTLLILNPGCTLSDAFSDAENSVQYLRSVAAGQQGYSFDIDMNTDEGGTYSVYITAGDNRLEPESFDFYSKSVKEAVTGELNEAKNIDTELLDRVMSVFSLSNNRLYSEGDKSSIASTLEKIRAAQTGGIFGSDIEGVYKGIYQSLILTAYNTFDDAVFEDGMLRYTELLGIADTEEYADYLQSLSGAGRERLNNALLGGGYGTAEDFQNAFGSAVAYYVITDYSMQGYGHIPGFLKKYREIYEANGFDFSLNADNTVYAGLLSTPSKNLSELAALYNSLTLKRNTTPGAAYSSGAGGGSSNVKAQTTRTADNIYYEASPKTVFTDVSNDHWAAEYILSLYEKGIVSGTGDNSFEPSRNVTRAEFTRMITAALGAEPDYGEASFEDVDGTWSQPYVEAAYKMGWIYGVSEKRFEPDSCITREQSAAIIYRAIGAEEKQAEQFDDDESISDYARAAVYTLKAQGIISGRENNSFAPAELLTRAEAARMIYSMLDDGGTDK